MGRLHVANVCDWNTTKLRWSGHAPSEHGQFADTVIPHHGRHVVGKHTGHRWKVAGRISQSAGERDDGSLAFGDAVEIAHQTSQIEYSFGGWGPSASSLQWDRSSAISVELYLAMPIPKRQGSTGLVWTRQAGSSPFINQFLHGPTPLMRTLPVLPSAIDLVKFCF